MFKKIFLLLSIAMLMFFIACEDDAGEGDEGSGCIGDQELVEGVCVDPECIGNQTLVSGVCINPTCLDGQILIEGLCITSGTCNLNIDDCIGAQTFDEDGRWMCLC